ncbi:hypothetical protein H7H37_23250 [Mycolicibacterium insubricum]|nr:hypothetical protein [Mycolicibacterium insubricum]
MRAEQSGSADPGDRKLAYWWLRRLGTGPDRLTPIAGTEGWTNAELLAAAAPPDRSRTGPPPARWPLAPVTPTPPNWPPG